MKRLSTRESWLQQQLRNFIRELRRLAQEVLKFLRPQTGSEASQNLTGSNESQNLTGSEHDSVDFENQHLSTETNKGGERAKTELDILNRKIVS